VLIVRPRNRLRIFAIDVTPVGIKFINFTKVFAREPRLERFVGHSCRAQLPYLLVVALR
jgi:hypothetical protein